MTVVRRSREDYAQAFLDLLPPGPPFPRETDTHIHKLFLGLAGVVERVDQRVADFIEREADPRRTIEMLADWERNTGLPDPCVDEPLTIEDRRKNLVRRLTMLGRQDRDYFVEIAADLGYEIEIVEHRPFIVGITPVGDTRPTGAAGERYLRRIGPPSLRYYWTVRVKGARVSWFRAGSGQAGLDPLARIGTATDLECLFRRYKPAHTEVIFDYSEVQ